MALHHDSAQKLLPTFDGMRMRFHLEPLGHLAYQHDSGYGRCKDAGEAATDLDSTVYLTSKCFG